MTKKRGQKITSGSHSMQKHQQQTNDYLGQKTAQNYSTHDGMSHSKKNKGGCGCGGKVPKNTGSQIRK